VTDSARQRACRARLLAALLIALLCIGATACSADASPAAPDAPRRGVDAARPVDGDLTVLATTSMADRMRSEGASFEAQNPAVHVEVDALTATEITKRVRAGSGGDVVALDDQATLDDLDGHGLVASVTPVEGARAGSLAAVVASSNPSAATRFVEQASR
jgi:ABC-type glycerol-3-phosphate transport system substrate-binding protein